MHDTGSVPVIEGRKQNISGLKSWSMNGMWYIGPRRSTVSPVLEVQKPLTKKGAMNGLTLVIRGVIRARAAPKHPMSGMHSKFLFKRSDWRIVSALFLYGILARRDLSGKATQSSFAAPTICADDLSSKKDCKYGKRCNPIILSLIVAPASSLVRSFAELEISVARGRRDSCQD
jgi:hypothetical protein